MRADYTLSIYFDCKKEKNIRNEKEKDEEISFFNKDYCIIEEEEEEAKNYQEDLKQLLKIK